MNSIVSEINQQLENAFKMHMLYFNMHENARNMKSKEKFKIEMDKYANLFKEIKEVLDLAEKGEASSSDISKFYGMFVQMEVK